MKAFLTRIAASAYLDTRAVALFRWVLGLIHVIKFWGTIPRNFEQIFSPVSGVLGKCFADGYVAGYNKTPLLFAMEQDGALWTFTLLSGLVMFLFMIGVYPRLMAIVGSFLLWMFNVRYQMLWFGWEQYAQVLLFVAIFLPLNSRLSLTRCNPKEAGSTRFAGALALLALLQVTMIYFFNGLSKNGEHWLDGTAVQFAVGNPALQTDLGAWLLGQDFLAKLLSYGTLIWEICFPLLLFLPSKKNWLRMLAAISIVAFHWILSIFLEVGDFKFIAIAAALLLMPPEAMNLVPEKFWGFLKGFRRLPSISYQLPRWSAQAIGGILIFCMLGSNLKMSIKSKSEDRIKAWLAGGPVEGFLDAVLPSELPRYSFFAQHWHLFSPNPPSELGYVLVEIVEDNGKIEPIFDGRKLPEDGYPTKTAKFLMTYLSYDRENLKAEILANCLSSKEASRWHDQNKGKKAKRLSLALYSWRPKTLKDLKKGPSKGIERHELIGLNFKYD